MSLDWKKLSPEERDARITSLLLGELPPQEAEELRAIIGTDAELARACVRRGRTISLLREAAAAQGQAEVPVEPEVTAPARLSKERREKLLETFKSAAPAPLERARWRLQLPQWFLPMSAAAIFIGLLTFAATTLFSRRSRSDTMASVDSSIHGHWFGHDMSEKGVSQYRQSFASQMAEEQVALARLKPVDRRIQVSGQVAQDRMLAGVPNSDFSGKVESKAAEAARSSHRFAIILPDAENKERGRQLGREGEMLADFDSDPSKSVTFAQAGDKVAGNSEFYFSSGTTPRGSSVAIANGSEAKPYVIGSLDDQTKDGDGTRLITRSVTDSSPKPETRWDSSPQAAVSGLADVQRRGEVKAKISEPTPTSPTITDLEAKIPQSVAVDALKLVEAKEGDNTTTVRLQTPSLPQVVANYSVSFNEEYVSGDPAPALPATAGVTFSAGNSGFLVADGYAAVNDPSSSRARLEIPVPLPAVAPTFNNGNAMVASGGGQALGGIDSRDKNGFGTQLGAGVPSDGRAKFGRSLNQIVSRSGAAQEPSPGQPDGTRTLNESIARKDDWFGVQASDPVALGFSTAPQPAISPKPVNQPPAEAMLAEGLVTYNDGLQSPGRPAVNRQAGGLGVNGPAEPAGSLPALSLAEDAPLGAQDREWLFRGFGGLGGGAVGGAVNRPANAEGFGNRSAGAGVDFGRNQMYAGNSTRSDSQQGLNRLDPNRNGVVDSTARDGEARNPEPQNVQGRSSGAGANTSGLALGEVDAFTFGELQSGAGGGGRSGRGGGRRAVQDSGAIQITNFVQVPRTEFPITGKPLVQGDVGAPVPSADSVGLLIAPEETATAVAARPSQGALDALKETDPARIEAAKMVIDGKLLYETGRLKEAEEVLKKAAKIAPQNVGANYYLDLVKAQKVSAEARLGENAAGLVTPEIMYNPAKPESKAPTSASKAEDSPEISRLTAELENLRTLRDRVSQVYDVTAIEAKQSSLGAVQVIEPAEASASEKPSLLSRIGNAFSGGGVKRTTVVSVEPDMPDVDPQGRIMFRPKADPFLIQTESDRVRSTNVLKQVAEKLNLNEEWAKASGKDRLSDEETIALLKKRVEVGQQANTTLLEIRGKSENPEEAARIANAVAEAYGNVRNQSRAKITTSGLAGLKTQLAQQDKRIAEVTAQLEQKRKGLSVEIVSTNGPKPSTNAPIPQAEVLSRENAFSTFSLNVSDVSFKLAAASLEKGTMPDAASIRSEEFINAFDYRDPMPLPGTPLAFAWERARYPFAHNRDVVRFSVKTAAQGREAGKPLNIVVLLDNSGSMERADRVRIIQESLRTLAAQLKPQDKISVVTFARTASLRVNGVSGTNAIDVADKVGVLTPEGGTNLEEALDLAYRTALRHYEAGAANRIVLLTDGAANLGNVEPKTLKAKVENYRKQGIALDCFGIGWEGFNDDLLEQLSRNGDGRYGFVNTPEEAASEFVGQLAGALRVAASDVKMQVEFNPKRVTAWRQIGYAKHQLTKEQFRDNKVDAAEIGAAESGNALYVIETNPNGEGPVATVRARFRVPQTSDYREHEWVVPFGSAVELQQSAPSLRLAASASAFSEWLAASPFAGEVATERLLQVLSGVPETYGADPRPKRLEWMIRQAKSISGK